MNGFPEWCRLAALAICCAAAVCCGCATHRAIELDAQHPAVRVSTQGILFGEEFVPVEKVPEILGDYDVPHDRVIHILLDPDVRDLRPARTLMGLLSRAGYTRPVLVTRRHAESLNVGKRKRQSPKTAAAAKKAPAKRVIRYKRANE